MTEQFLDDAYAKLCDQLEETKKNVTKPLEQVVACLGSIKAVISEISTALEGFSFDQGLDEVAFNKHWMVQFYALFIYETESFRIADGLPKRSGKVLRRYYSGFISEYNSYFLQHHFWFGYFRNHMDLLDAQLFTGNAADVLFLPECPDYFARSFPACTYIFGRFMAYERLVSELNEKINPTGSSDQGKTYTHGLTWTGNKVNVAELAYGLYYAGQFNHGNAEVTDIYKWLEESLGISMGSVHRKFIDLRRRNTASPTKLLDKMRESIHQRIDEDLKFKPNRGIKLNKPLDGD